MLAMTGARRLRLFMTIDAVGGIWQYGLDLARELSRYRIEPTIALVGPSPGMDQLESAGAVPGARLICTELPLDWTARDRGQVLAAGKRLAELAEASGADVIHLNSPAFAAGARFHAPVVAVSHSCPATWWDAVRTGPLPADLAWRAELTGRGLHVADARLAPSAAFAEATAAAYGLLEPPLVVHNGRREPRRALPATADRHFAFTAGRLWDAGKNLDALDRAAARLALPVLAAGPLDGPNGVSARPSHVRALGRLGDEAIRAHLAARPVFVSVARYEPFGLAVLEAAQAGCALVLSDIPTFRELWGGVAVFVPPDDAGAIAATIEALAEDEAARDRLGTAARLRARRFSVEAMAEGVLAAYRKLGVGVEEEARGAA